MTSVFDKQPSLENDLIKIVPLRAVDFDVLYAVASDPLIWEQHPNKERYQKDVFRIFFKGAMESDSAFLVTEKTTGTVIGTSRYYEPDMENDSVAIGYTFIGRAFWGSGYNASLKKLMIDYAFSSFSAVIFHIGIYNMRSQKAIEKLGAVKIGQLDVAYYGEPSKPNFVYQITKEKWSQR